jgi:hypothetical protein
MSMNVTFTGAPAREAILVSQDARGKVIAVNHVKTLPNGAQRIDQYGANGAYLRTHYEIGASVERYDQHGRRT